MPADPAELTHLKLLLHDFALSTGLKVNFNKSFLIPINIENDKTEHLANTLECQVGVIPFTYLGLPLGTTRPAVQEYMPLELY